MSDSPPEPTRTPRFSRIVGQAAEIAVSMGHGYVGVEHLFLAIIRDPAAVPTQVLATMIDVDSVDARLAGFLKSPGYGGAYGPQGPLGPLGP